MTRLKAERIWPAMYERYFWKDKFGEFKMAVWVGSEKCSSRFNDRNVYAFAAIPFSPRDGCKDES